MKGDYPSFQVGYSTDQLRQEFFLAPEELDFIRQFRSDVNRCSVAIRVFPVIVRDSQRLDLLLWSHGCARASGRMSNDQWARAGTS